MTTSDLVRGESSLMNLAYPSKAFVILNQIRRKLRVADPMVKVKLPEIHWEDTSGKGSILVCYRYSITTMILLMRFIVGSVIVQTTRSSKTKSGSPKGTYYKHRELRDCLRVGLVSPIYGNRDLVVGKILLKEVRTYSSKGIEERSGVRPNMLPKKFTKLINICSRRDKDFKANDIYDLMYNEQLYEIAYHKLKSNPGNMTPGINPTTLDGMSSEVLRKIIASLKDDSFQFSPSRRVNIPKSGGGTRPLTVAPPRDKIVQEVMRMILEAIFEPIFSDNSHGFRAKRSCHTALKQIKGQFGAASYIIEGDISKCFPSIDHKILMNLVKERISDERFLQLIWKSLKAGYCEFHQVKNNIVGTFQGSIISPILSNIYLHQFDSFVEEIKKNFDLGKEAQRNPVYRNLEYQRSKAIRGKDTVQARLLLKKMQLIKSRLPNDPNFRRLYYVRYADD
jgi:group II intron reverse transcriptase/maturase